MMKTMRKQALPLILAVVALLLVFGAVKAEAMADNVLSVSTEADLKAALQLNGYEIILKQDLTLRSCLDITGNDLVLDLNQHMLRNETANGSFMFSISGRNVKIMNGDINADLQDGYAICVQREAGDLWLEKIEMWGDYQCAISAQAQTGSTLYLNDVTIRQDARDDSLYALVHVTGDTRLVANTLLLNNGSEILGDREKPLIAAGPDAKLELYNTDLLKNYGGKILQIESGGTYLAFCNPSSAIRLDDTTVHTYDALQPCGTGAYQVRGTKLEVRISENQLQITAVDLWVWEPNAGEKPAFEVNSTGQHVRTTFHNTGGYFNGIAWQAFGEQKLTPDDTFAGGTCTLYLQLIPEPGWAFAEDVTVTVNDAEAYAADYGNGFLTVRRSFVIPPVFTEIPKDQIAMKPDPKHPDPAPAVFKAAVSSYTPVTFQWQVSKDGGVTWADCKNGKGGASGVTTNELWVIGSDDNDGNRYQCVVTCEGETYESVSAKLTVYAYPWITEGPRAKTAAVGQTVAFDVVIAGDDDFSFQWYYKPAGSSSWSKVKAASGKTCQYVLKTEARHNGYQYRCEITRMADGKKIPGCITRTDAVKLTVKKLSITAQPKNAAALAGSTMKFTVGASGAGVKYQWQYRKEGVTAWSNSSLSTAKTKTLSVTAAPKHNGYQWRCRVTDGAGTKAYTKAVTANVLSITTQPKNTTAAVGKTAKFTVKADGKNLKYQWYYRTSASGTWKKSGVTGNATAVLTTNTLKTSHNGYQYRCRVTAGTVSRYTNTVTLTVVTKPAVTTQPKPKTVSAGQTASFKVVAAGGGLRYQWYYKKPSGSWTAVTAASGKTATYSLTAQARHNGYQYRCKISNAAGSVTSSAVTLTVQ